MVGHVLGRPDSKGKTLLAKTSKDTPSTKAKNIIDAEVVEEIPAKKDAPKDTDAAKTGVAADPTITADGKDVLEKGALDDSPVIDETTAAADLKKTGSPAKSEDVTPPVADVGHDANADQADTRGHDLDLPASADAEAPDPDQAEHLPDSETTAPLTHEHSNADSNAMPHFRNTVLAMGFGGVIAAALGFAVADYSGARVLFGGTSAQPSAFETQTSESLTDQAFRISELSDRMQTTEGRVTSSLAASDAQLKAMREDLEARTQQIEELDATLSSILGRLDTLETRPLTEAVGPEIVAAYQRELDALRAAIAAQRAEVEAFAATAIEAERAADAKAHLARGRTALARISAAMETGSAFADDLALVTKATGTPVPAALDALSETGARTQIELVESFPAVARAALAAARKEEPRAEGAGGRVSNFLRTQLGVRSVAPRDGTDADAILSRAEAALKGGDLDGALAEIAALPEAAKAALSGWLESATDRHAALAALHSLSTELTQD